MKHLLRLLAGVLSLSLLDFSVVAGKSDGALDIYWVDSMGGGSTLIVTPDGESILVDTGNPGGRDAGRIHKVATSVAGLERIDHVIVTHFHIDHYGGAPELAQLIPVGIVHDNGLPERDPDGRQDPTWPQRIRGYREMPVAGRSVVRPGEGIPVRQREGAPSMKVTFLGGMQKFAPEKGLSGSVAAGIDCEAIEKKAADKSDNANSVVTLIEFGSFRFFNGGDVSWNTEATLVCPELHVGAVDVFQVNHHGLDVSNHPLLLQALAPRVAVFNNGPRKGCMPAVVSTLRGLKQPPDIYQVHKNLRSEESNTAPDRWANEGEVGGEYLLLKVAPDAKTYELYVPRTGHIKKFTTGEWR